MALYDPLRETGSDDDLPSDSQPQREEVLLLNLNVFLPTINFCSLFGKNTKIRKEESIFTIGN